MIKVGEMGGKLDRVMNSLADYYERDSAIKKKTKSAFSYPIMLGSMTIGIVVVMLAFVIPTFRTSLSSLDLEVEGLTKAVYDISDFVIAYGLYILAGIIVVVVALILFKKTKKGSYFFDWFKVHAPVLKNVNRDLINARFARGFGLLLSSGMDITDALDAVEVILGNRYVRKRFRAAAESIKHGASLAVAFDSYKLFPQIMIQMIQIGEKTASLDEVLSRACNFFDLQVSTSMDSLVAKIQPIMLLIIGGIIGVLFIAVYSPMLTIMEGLNV